MSGAADAIVKGLKLEIGRTTFRRWLTQQQIAVVLGRNAGDIQKGLRQMVVDQLMLASDDEPTRGTLYQLNPVYEADLERALEVEQAPGLLTIGQTVMLVRASSTSRLSAVLGDMTNSSAVAWAGPGTTGREMLLVLRSDATYEQVQELETALEAAGAESLSHRLNEAISARRLRATNADAARAATGGDPRVQAPGGVG